jgi:hypothetical protein
MLRQIPARFVLRLPLSRARPTSPPKCQSQRSEPVDRYENRKQYLQTSRTRTLVASRTRVLASGFFPNKKVFSSEVGRQEGTKGYSVDTPHLTQLSSSGTRGTPPLASNDIAWWRSSSTPPSASTLEARRRSRKKPPACWPTSPKSNPLREDGDADQNHATTDFAYVELCTEIGPAFQPPARYLLELCVRATF